MNQVIEEEGMVDIRMETSSEQTDSVAAGAFSPMKPPGIPGWKWRHVLNKRDRLQAKS